MSKREFFCFFGQCQTGVNPGAVTVATQFFGRVCFFGCVLLLNALSNDEDGNCERARSSH